MNEMIRLCYIHCNFDSSRVNINTESCYNITASVFMRVSYPAAVVAKEMEKR